MPHHHEFATAAEWRHFFEREMEKIMDNLQNIKDAVVALKAAADNLIAQHGTMVSPAELDQVTTDISAVTASLTAAATAATAAPIVQPQGGGGPGEESATPA